ncbi:MAG: hypothetical protein J6K04_13425 [Lachnospiraceae bacterium]|nr:hypothetical protein [Lachnospiraceae bacterium]
MNLLNTLLYQLALLDVAFGPSFSAEEVNATTDPVTKVILIVVFICFLAFIGYLIWNSLKKKK